MRSQQRAALPPEASLEQRPLGIVSVPEHVTVKLSRSEGRRPAPAPPFPAQRPGPRRQKARPSQGERTTPPRAPIRLRLQKRAPWPRWAAGPSTARDRQSVYPDARARLWPAVGRAAGARGARWRPRTRRRARGLALESPRGSPREPRARPGRAGWRRHWDRRLHPSLHPSASAQAPSTPAGSGRGRGREGAPTSPAPGSHSCDLAGPSPLPSASPPANI